MRACRPVRIGRGMNSSLAYGSYGSATQDRTRTLFGQTMGYVAVTAGFFALGSYLGRNLSQGWTFVWFIVAIACLITMNFTARRSRSGSLSTVLLFVVGTALGLAMATVNNAAVASSSRRSRCSTNSGTSVADNTPPRSSSYTMFGVEFARL